MDTSTDQYESDLSRPGSFSAISKTVMGIFRWLLGLVVLTDEERTKAGIYHGGEGRDK
jgi:hypothetical protein